MTVKMIRLDLTAVELRGEAAGTKDAGAARRMLAMALLLEGQGLRQNFLSNRVYDNYEAIVDACCAAWNALIALPESIRSITQRNWAIAVNP